MAIFSLSLLLEPRCEGRVNNGEYCCISGSFIESSRECGQYRAKYDCQVRSRQRSGDIAGGLPESIWVVNGAFDT